jgi:hypothetical protein
LVFIAQACAEPALTAMKYSPGPDGGATCPKKSPQHASSNVDLIPHEYPHPELTATNGPAGGLVEDSPQQAAAPLVLMAQPWSLPAAIPMNVPLGEAVLPPQHTAEPLVVIAHVSPQPAVIVEATIAGCAV